MPFHKGFNSREGFRADSVFKLIGLTALNPALLFPLVLLARYSKRGQDLSILHPTAYRRIKTLLWLAVARSVSRWASERVASNGVTDEYEWDREIVLVTGGAGGIGGCIVRLFEERGVTVVVLDVQPMSFSHSSKVHHYTCDIRSPQQVASVASQIRSEVGSPTIIINNAGVARGKTILDADPSDIKFTFDVNTLAPFWVTKSFLPAMVARNHGTVVTVSSTAAFFTAPNMVDYAASKAASLAFHEGLTAELTTRYNAPMIRTIVVHPGHTRTALFTGFDSQNEFLVPQLYPESVAEAIVKKILKGQSGSVILPASQNILPWIRALPDWYTLSVRAKGEAFMRRWKGKQVIEDVSKTIEDKLHQAVGDSTVLVSGEGQE